MPFVARYLFATAIASAVLAPVPLSAQHGPHQSAVHVGKGEWVSPEVAEERGWFLYRDTWLPKKYARKVKSWDRADAKVEGWPDAWRAKAKHYRIRTNAPRYVVELEIVPFLDEVYEVFASVFREDFGLKVKGVDNQQIDIYWGYPAWRDDQGRTRGNPGFYVSDGTLNVLYDRTDPDQFHKTVFHEGAHQFFRSLLPGAELPHWLNEALAVYMEGCTYSPATGKLTKGHLPQQRLDLAQREIQAAKSSGESIAPQDMFMQFGKPDFDARHYALAWSFVYYLIHREDGAHKQDFYRFLSAMNGAGRKSVYEVFASATRKDLAEIEKGWAPFVLALEMTEKHARMLLEPLREESAIRKGDQLIMIDGHDIDGYAAFEKHWTERDRSRPARLLVRRKSERRGHMDYELSFVTIDVPAGDRDDFCQSGSVPYTKSVVQ